MKALNLVSLVAWIALVLLPANTTAAAVVQFASDQLAYAERPDFSAEVYPLGVNITPPFTPPAVIAIRVVGGTAKPGEDFVIGEAEGMTLTGGTLQPYFVIRVLDDGIREPDETIELELRVVSGNVVVGERRNLLLTLKNRPAGFEFVGKDGARNLWYGMEPTQDPGFRENSQPHLVLRRVGDRETATTAVVEFAVTDRVMFDLDTFQGAPPVCSLYASGFGLICFKGTFRCGVNLLV